MITPGMRPDTSAAADFTKELRAPSEMIALKALPAKWRRAEIVIRCRHEGNLVDRHDVAGKLRGALGEALKATASDQALAGEPCPWSPPSALDILFRCQGRMTKALDIPKPYVIGLDRAGSDLLAVLTLFGAAAEWRQSVGDAWVRALRGPLSIGRPLDVVDRVIDDRMGVCCPAGEKLRLVFRTPVQIRQGQHRKDLTLPDLISSLGNRISGLARWHGLHVDADWKGLKEHASRLSMAKLSSETHRWRRYSRRQEREMPLAGDRQSWLIEGDLSPLMPLLSIGVTTHAGSRTTLGLGRFRLEGLDGRTSPAATPPRAEMRPACRR